MKKRFWAVLAVVLGMTGCKADADTNQADIEQAALEITETTTTVTETSAESSDSAAETVTIAGQEFSVDVTELFLWDMPVTDEDMQKLLNFKRLKNLSVDLLADGCEINDMNVLPQIKTLETLCINGTYSDLGFLNGMTGLKSLSLMHFNCDKLEKLPNNTALTEINLDECSIDGLDWITDFPSLKKVSFNHVDVTNLDPIGELKDLEILSVTFSAGRAIDFSFLQNVKKLKSLTFTPFPSSSVYDLDVLADCTALEELDISGTYKDLEFCRSLTNLKKFSIISDNHFVYDILPLTECVNLQELKLGCDFDSMQFDTLKSALPNFALEEQTEKVNISIEYEFDLDKYLENGKHDEYLLRNELDFLSDEQYDIYIKALIFVDNLGNYAVPSTGNRSSYFFDENGEISESYISNESNTVHIYPYFYVSTYQSFYEYLQSVFTQDAVDAIVSNERFLTLDGELYFKMGDAGGLLYFDDSEYNVIEKNDSEIVFEYIAHRLINNEEWICTHQTKLVHTDNGWRSEFFKNLYSEKEVLF